VKLGGTSEKGEESIVLGCNGTDEKWTRTCIGNQWSGPTSNNCTQSGGSIYGSSPVFDTSDGFHYYGSTCIVI